MHYFYKIHDFVLESQMIFPELIEVPQQKSHIIIVENLVPYSLRSKIKTIFEGGLLYEKVENQLLLFVKDAGRVLIEEGKIITFERIDQADDSTLRLYLLGSCLSFALMMQGLFPLHGSVVTTKYGTAMFMGESGRGKSTIAAAFNAKGHEVLSDDVSIVKFNSNNIPIVFPSVRHIKLWNDSVDELGYDKKQLIKASSNWDKWQIGIGNSHDPQPSPLSIIYDLNPGEDKHLGISPIFGLEKLNVLLKNMHRPTGIEIFGLENAYFKYCTKLAKCLPVKKLSRSTEVFDISRLYEAIMFDLTNLNA